MFKYFFGWSSDNQASQEQKNQSDDTKILLDLHCADVYLRQDVVSFLQNELEQQQCKVLVVDTVELDQRNLKHQFKKLCTSPVRTRSQSREWSKLQNEQKASGASWMQRAEELSQILTDNQNEIVIVIGWPTELKSGLRQLCQSQPNQDNTLGQIQLLSLYYNEQSKCPHDPHSDANFCDAHEWFVYDDALNRNVLSRLCRRMLELK